MSIIRCDSCEKTVDSDYEEIHMDENDMTIILCNDCSEEGDEE